MKHNWAQRNLCTEQEKSSQLQQAFSEETETSPVLWCGIFLDEAFYKRERTQGEIRIMFRQKALNCLIATFPFSFLRTFMSNQSRQELIQTWHFQSLQSEADSQFDFFFLPGNFKAQRAAGAQLLFVCCLVGHCGEDPSFQKGFCRKAKSPLKRLQYPCLFKWHSQVEGKQQRAKRAGRTDGKHSAFGEKKSCVLSPPPQDERCSRCSHLFPKGSLGLVSQIQAGILPFPRNAKSSPEEQLRCCELEISFQTRGPSAQECL